MCINTGTTHPLYDWMAKSEENLAQHKIVARKKKSPSSFSSLFLLLSFRCGRRCGCAFLLLFHFIFSLQLPTASDSDLNWKQTLTPNEFDECARCEDELRLKQIHVDYMWKDMDVCILGSVWLLLLPPHSIRPIIGIQSDCGQRPLVSTICSTNNNLFIIINSRTFQSMCASHTWNVTNRTKKRKREKRRHTFRR